MNAPITNHLRGPDPAGSRAGGLDERGAPSDQPGAPFGLDPTPTPTRRRWLRRTVLVAVVVLGVWGLAAGFTLYRARQSLLAGKAALDVLTTTEPTEMFETPFVEQLNVAEGHLRDGKDAANSAVLAPARILPVVGTQLRSVDALSTASLEMVTAAERASTDGKAIVDRPSTDGAGRLAKLTDTQALVADLRTTVDGLDLGPTGGLLGPLADARGQFQTKADDVATRLADLDDTLGLLAEVLTGPRRYLILGANNAEMRAGHGTLLSAGTLEVNGGDLAVSPMLPIKQYEDPLRELQASGLGVVPMRDPDVAANWAHEEPNIVWTHLGVTPRFDVTGEMAAEMWEAAGGAPVDGVLVVDPVAMGAILDATGPITVDGREFTSDTIVGYLLHDQYLEFGDDHEARRDQYARITQAVFERLATSGVDPIPLAEALRAAAKGRHVLGWSYREADAGLWHQFDITGELGPESLMVSLLNAGGDKYDQFVHVSAELDMVGRDGTGTQWQLTLTSENRAEPGLELDYCCQTPDLTLEPGDYAGILVVNLPGPSTAIRMEGAGASPALTNDGPSRALISERFVLKPGDTNRRVVSFTTPTLQREMTLEPSARVPAINWIVDGDDLGVRASLSWEHNDLEAVRR